MCNNQVEADKLGYCGANEAVIQGSEEALANLAAVSVSNCTVVTTLTTTNVRISKELANTRIQIATLTADSIALQLKVARL